MRKGLLFLLVGALVFAVTPAVMAGTQNNITYDVEESAHNDYGAAEWHNTWLANSQTPFSPNQFAGDESWGYATGMVPFGPGMIETDSSTILPPLYTDPCPADMLGPGYDMDTAGGCPIHTLTSGGFNANTNTTFWQTADTATDTDEALFLDDMLAKMFQADPIAGDGITEGLNQTLDILFYLEDTQVTYTGAGAGTVYMDQTLDQDLVYFEGDDSSYLGSITANAGEGVKIRLTSLVEGGDQPHFIDQWLVSFVKDTGEAWPEGRIVSSYSSWFRDGDPNTCTVCTYTYPVGHDPIVKTVPEIDNHP
jgi:hypothetical protein